MSAARTPALTVELRRTVRSGYAPSQREIAHWASLALGRRARGAQLSLLLVGPARSRALNARYRGRDKPTNILSFPAMAAAPTLPAAASNRPLGDLVICPSVLRAEARAQGKSERAHWAHLIVHGVLHLIGYDHEHAADAQRMERREIRVLRRLGFPNPYRPAGAEHG